MLALVEDLHTKKSSFRLLGCWSDKRETEWKLLHRFDEPFDLEPVKEQLDILGAAPGWCWERVPEIQQGMVWTSATEEAADRPWSSGEAPCHLRTSQKDRSSKSPESDRAADEIPAEWTSGDGGGGGSQWT